jgi:uncharacterized membrane protein YdjX (TVP38/TMEM64 family)
MKSDHDAAEEAAPVVSVRKLLPPEFWEEGDDDDDSPDNSKTFWQTWGSFIIVSIVVGLILLAFLLVILLCPVKAWVTAARAWKDEHYTLLCLIYIPTVVAAIMLLLPSSPFELFGVILLGPWIGFGLNVTANLAAAAASFPLGRALLSGWVKRTVRQSRVMLVLARSIHTHPLRAMLVVRFLYITSGLKNYLIAAIPNVSFLAYMLVALVHALVHDAITSAIGMRPPFHSLAFSIAAPPGG